MGRRSRLSVVLVLAAAAIVGGPGGLAGPTSANAFHFSPGPWLSLAAQAIAPFTTTQISNGTDGRLTILLVGSDYRPRTAGTGERTDSMMLLTIDNSKRISAVSLPRDVGNFPIGPNEIFKPKVNGLFKHFKQTYGTREAALEHMRTAFEYAFGIQIDYVTMIRFAAVDRLIDQVSGVPVAVPYNIYDKSIVDDRFTKQHGAKFLPSASTLMLGNSAPLCYTVGSPINWNASPNCTRGLLYVRSRHGPGNNDWRRARRQQSFVMAAINRVISRGTGSLDSLRISALSNGQDFYTTLPTDSGSVVDMYNRLSGSSMPNQAVLQPPTYASNVPGTFKQQLRLDAVRALMRSWFGPIS
jgi:anionic cell wall polymer biosynthesis LytR-Cps2A-Psr (LCP) family protein